MAVPNDLATVDAVAAEGYFGRVAQGDQRAASLFARLVAYRLNPNGDQTGWGWLTKSGAEAQVDGYAEDAIVYGSDPNDLNNVVDVVTGAGAPGATTRWGPAPRRASNRWEAPRPLSATDLAYLRGDDTAPPQPPAGAGWTAAHTALLARFPATAPPRAWIKKVAEQFAFSFPGEGWGCKTASPERPQSDNVIARQTSTGLVGYQMIASGGVSTPINLAGQYFIAVTPTNYLGVTGGPPPPTPPPRPPFAVDPVALGQTIGDMVWEQYAEKVEAPNAGMGIHVFCTADDIYRGMAPAEAIAKRKRELRAALGLPAA